MISMMIQEAIIYAITAIFIAGLSLWMIFRHLAYIAEMNQETQRIKAQYWYRSDVATANAEAGAMNFTGNEGQNQELGLTQILGLLSNPQVQSLLSNFKKKE